MNLNVGVSGMDSIKEITMPDMWHRKVCNCGLSSEPHYRYVRDDMAMVSINHGESGTELKKTLYVSGPCVGDELTGFRNPRSAMQAVDKKWPITKQ